MPRPVMEYPNRSHVLGRTNKIFHKEDMNIKIKKILLGTDTYITNAYLSL